MSDILEEGRRIAEEHSADFTGKLNAYECDGDTFAKQPGCGHYIVTIDRHHGVTPFMVKCGNCGRFAHSKMYRVQPNLTPTHEWYRPETLAGIPENAYDHLSKGGLLLRPIGEDRWQKPLRVLTIDSEMARMKALMAAAAHDAEKVERQHKVMSDTPLDRSNFPSRQAWRRAKRGKL